MFSTRDRAEHTRKRKTVSHTFSAKSIGQFEQYMHNNIEDLIAQWDRMSKSAGGDYAHMDALHWFNYLLLTSSETWLLELHLACSRREGITLKFEKARMLRPRLLQLSRC